jgi:hypothetical protein
VTEIDNPWTLAVNDGQPVRCDFDAGKRDGLKYMTFTVFAAYPELLGDTVPIPPGRRLTSG